MCLSQIPSAHHSRQMSNARNIVFVPCGRCDECLNRKRQEWSIRIQKEYEAADRQNSLFITLTYSNSFIPVYRRTGYFTLDKGEVQRWIRKLREHHEHLLAADIKNQLDIGWTVARKLARAKSRLHYFIVGEYGSKQYTRRPHYHMILLNARPEIRKWIKFNWHSRNQIKLIRGTRALHYCTKYIQKGAYRGDEKEHEFHIASRGMGNGFFSTREADQIYRERRTFIMVGGHKHTLPRYYYTRIFTNKFVKLKMHLDGQDWDQKKAEEYSRFLKKFEKHRDPELEAEIQHRNKFNIERKKLKASTRL